MFDYNTHKDFGSGDPRTGKRGRPKTKDGKIDMKNLDLTRMEKMEMKDIEGTCS